MGSALVAGVCAAFGSAPALALVCALISAFKFGWFDASVEALAPASSDDWAEVSAVVDGCAPAAELDGVCDERADDCVSDCPDWLLASWLVAALEFSSEVELLADASVPSDDELDVSEDG